MIAVGIVRDVFSPMRDCTIVRRRKAATVEAICKTLKRARPAGGLLVAHLDGRWLRPSEWAGTVVYPGSRLSFYAIPCGGGGGGGKSVFQIVGTVVALAALAFAGPLGGAIAGALGFTAGTVGFTIASTLASAAIVAGASLLISAVTPRRNDASTPINSNREDTSTSYAYSLSAQGNTARIGAPLPVLFGQHRVIPDYAAAPWAEWINNEQFVHILLVITHGIADIDEIRFGDTPISAYEAVQTQTITGSGTPTLFETNVYPAPDVSGVVLEAPNDLSTGSNGVSGPFAVCPPGRTTNRVGVDISFPNGLFLANTSGGFGSLGVQWRVDARPVDDAGAIIGPETLVAIENFSASGGSTFNTLGAGVVRDFRGGGFPAGQFTTPLSVSYRYTMPTSSRWAFTVRRLDTRNMSSSAGHQMAWTGLKGFLGTPALSNLTALALRLKATNQLNDQTFRRVSVLATRRLPLYDIATGTWSAPQRTSSVAAALSSVLMDTQTGGRLPVRSFDAATLWQLDQVWAARGDQFNGIFDRAATLWDAVEKITTVGRTKAYHQGGVIRFHRDRPQTLPVQVFSTQNMTQGSFEVEYRLPNPDDAPDGVEVEYFDRRTWKPSTVTVDMAGVEVAYGSLDNPAREQLFGITDRAHALREASYIALANRRRIFPVFKTEMEGLIVSYGDMITIQHDVPRWGGSGQVYEWNPSTRLVTLFQGVVLDDLAGSWLARFRDDRGRPSEAIPISSWSSDSSFVLTLDPTYPGGAPFPIGTGEGRERTHVSVGKVGDEPIRAIVLGAVPQGRTVKILTVVENDAVHAN